MKTELCWLDVPPPPPPFFSPKSTVGGGGGLGVGAAWMPEGHILPGWCGWVLSVLASLCLNRYRVRILVSRSALPTSLPLGKKLVNRGKRAGPRCVAPQKRWWGAQATELAGIAPTRHPARPKEPACFPFQPGTTGVCTQHTMSSLT